MSSAVPHWMSRIGGTLSIAAAAILILAEWRTWSDPLEVAQGLVFCVSTGVALSMLWTLIQAAIHTRLGRQAMFPDQAPSAASPRIGWWVVVMTGLLLLWYRIAHWSGTVSLYEYTDSLLLTIACELEVLLLMHLWPHLVLGSGLGFTIALLEHRVGRRDRLTHAGRRLLSDGQ